MRSQPSVLFLPSALTYSVEQINPSGAISRRIEPFRAAITGGSVNVSDKAIEWWLAVLLGRSTNINTDVHASCMAVFITPTHLVSTRHCLVRNVLIPLWLTRTLHPLPLSATPVSHRSHPSTRHSLDFVAWISESTMSCTSANMPDGCGELVVMQLQGIGE
jgi:hypothetical protein